LPPPEKLLLRLGALRRTDVDRVVVERDVVDRRVERPNPPLLTCFEGLRA